MERKRKNLYEGIFDTPSSGSSSESSTESSGSSSESSAESSAESSKAYSETADDAHHDLRPVHEILLSDAETGDVDEEDIGISSETLTSDDGQASPADDHSTQGEDVDEEGIAFAEDISSETGTSDDGALDVF